VLVMEVPMRTSISCSPLIAVCLALLALPSSAVCQQPESSGVPGRTFRRDAFPEGRPGAPNTLSVRGPILGFTVDEAGGVRVIRGVPGAASFTAPVASVRGLAGWAVSSQKGYVLGASGEAARLVLLRNLSAVPERVELPIETGAGARIVLSPSGSSAAVFDAGGRLVVLDGLPDHPFPRWRAPADLLPGGIQTLAVSDRGDAVLAAAGNSLVRIRLGGAWDFIAPLNGPARLAFVPGRDEAVYLDETVREVVRLRFTASGALLEPLFGAADGLRQPVGIAVEAAADTVYVADAALPGVFAFDLSSRALSLVRSPGVPVTLTRLRGAGLFQLTSGVGKPVYLFDGGRGSPRVAFIPAAMEAIDGGGK